MYELPDASCPDCAKETHAFEGRCMAQLFRGARAFFGAYGRRRKSKDRSKLPVVFGEGTPDEEERWVDVSEYPFTVAMPMFPAPGIFIGRDRAAGLENMDFILKATSHAGAYERAQALSAADPKKRRVSVPATLPVGDFYKLLAKTGHALATMIVGHGAFTPMLRALIVDSRDDAREGPYFVGSALFGDMHITTMSRSPAILHEGRVLIQEYEGSRYLTTRIQFFAPMEAPVYEAVVAQIPPDWRPASPFSR